MYHHLVATAIKVLVSVNAVNAPQTPVIMASEVTIVAPPKARHIATWTCSGPSLLQASASTANTDDAGLDVEANHKGYSRPLAMLNSKQTVRFCSYR